MKRYFLLFLLLVGCQSPCSIESLSGIDKLDLLDLHNGERIQARLAPLAMHLQLDIAAQGHADWMAEVNRLSHTGRSGSTVSNRVKKQWTLVGENIAYGQEDAKMAVRDWMNSSGHRANIMNSKFQFVGFGISERDGRLYWCAVFSN